MLFHAEYTVCSGKGRDTPTSTLRSTELTVVLINLAGGWVGGAGGAGGAVLYVRIDDAMEYHKCNNSY
jgi:hypothetical protein